MARGCGNMGLPQEHSQGQGDWKRPNSPLENLPGPVETSRRRRPCPTVNPANPANSVHACVQEIGEGKVGVVMAWVWMSEVGVAAWRKVVARGCGNMGLPQEHSRGQGDWKRPNPPLENLPGPVETSRRRRPSPTANPANPANPVHACVQEIGEGKVGVVMAWRWVSEVGIAA